jgi:hypothetical protein
MVMNFSGDEIWVSSVNVETKEHSKQRRHTFTKEAENV